MGVPVSYWAAVTAVGLVLRIALVFASPRWGFFTDHGTFVRWGIQATDDGVLTVYDRLPSSWPLRIWCERSRGWVVREWPAFEKCNYPPLTVYLYYLSGVALKSLDPDRVINTVTSRAAFAFWSILADVLMAWGCAALVGRLKPGRAAWWTYLLVLLAPPLWWDSAVWGQTDSLVLAPAVWMLWAMIQHRWPAAGLFYGLAAALKPQAVLFLPLWGLVLLTARPLWKPLIALATAATVLLVAALPFMVYSGPAWWQSSYVHNLLAACPNTTLKAFNIWYADLLMCDSDDVNARWFGLTKDLWGKALLVGTLAAGFLWALRRWGGSARAYVLWSVLSLLACVMLPTRVHERYLLLVLPFLIVAATLYRRLIPGLCLLLVVATAQVTWPHWMKMPQDYWKKFDERAEWHYQLAVEGLPPEKRPAMPSFEEYRELAREEYLRGRTRCVPWEWGFTLLALAGAAATAASAASLGPDSRQSSGRGATQRNTAES